MPNVNPANLFLAANRVGDAIERVTGDPINPSTPEVERTGIAWPKWKGQALRGRVRCWFSVGANPTRHLGDVANNIANQLLVFQTAVPRTSFAVLRARPLALVSNQGVRRARRAERTRMG